MPKIWNAAEYDQQSVMQYSTSMRLLDERPFSGIERVLDIGCGSGKITSQIALKLVPHGSVHGLDINAEMIDYAKAHYPAPNLTFETADILDIEYENEFDLAVSFWTLSWLPLDAQLAALNNIIRSLKEDGAMLLMYPLRHDIYDAVESLIKTEKWREFYTAYPMPRAFISDEDYKEIISQIPMDISTHLRELEYLYENEDEMMDSINCWLGHVDILPSPEMKREFLGDLVDLYKKNRGITKPAIYYSILEIAGLKMTFQPTNTFHPG